MKLLIDQDIARTTAELLRDLGYDAVSAREIGMARSPDLELIQYAVEHQRFIATLDSDYHQIIVTDLLPRPSVILLRIPSPAADTASRMIDRVCSLYASELLDGCLLTCTLKAVRIRKIPFPKR